MFTLGIVFLTISIFINLLTLILVAQDNTETIALRGMLIIAIASFVAGVILVLVFRFPTPDNLVVDWLYAYLKAGQFSAIVEFLAHGTLG